MSPRSYAGTRVVLTGAASGIGRATALDLARRGARLALVDLDRARLDAVTEEARAHGAIADAFVADLGDADAIARLADALLARLGAIDVLVNNAGVAVVAPLVKTSAADWEWVMNVNAWGPIRLTQALLPSMLARREGRVVFVASMAGLVGAPGMVAYSTTKHAVVGFAESLRHEVTRAGIGVTVVCPGYVRTGLHRATRYGNARFERFLDRPPRWYGVSSEHAATRLLEGALRGEELVVIGPERFGWWLARLSPRVAGRLTRAVAGALDIARDG